MVYAIGTLCSVTPDSRVKLGTMAIFWLGINDAKGFSGCVDVFSAGFSDQNFERILDGTNGVCRLKMSH